MVEFSSSSFVFLQIANRLCHSSFAGHQLRLQFSKSTPICYESINVTAVDFHSSEFNDEAADFYNEAQPTLDHYVADGIIKNLYTKNWLLYEIDFDYAKSYQTLTIQYARERTEKGKIQVTFWSRADPDGTVYDEITAFSHRVKWLPSTGGSTIFANVTINFLPDAPLDGTKYMRIKGLGKWYQYIGFQENDTASSGGTRRAQFYPPGEGRYTDTIAVFQKYWLTYYDPGNEDCTLSSEFLCNSKAIDCTNGMGTMHLRHLDFDKPFIAIDNTIVPISGKVVIGGTGADTSPYDGSTGIGDGCPIQGAKGKLLISFLFSFLFSIGHRQLTSLLFLTSSLSKRFTSERSRRYGLVRRDRLGR